MCVKTELFGGSGSGSGYVGGVLDVGGRGSYVLNG